MIYHDKVYGKVKITESVILDLINCPDMQRLKGIDQMGYSEPYFPNTKRSRFEHSVGVYLLLQKYGASLEEQISGLIHDVSHAVFSHVIDRILKGDTKEQNHQDNIFADFVMKTQIPEILRRYNLKPEYILDDCNFPLKEKTLPDLCADRIDYLLRDSISFGEIKDANYFLENLTINDSRWIFRTFESAKKFTELFLKVNRIYYASLPVAVMFKTVGDYFNYAFDRTYISVDDFYTTDKTILAKAERHLKNDPRLKLLRDRMENMVSYKNDSSDYEEKISLKSRIVDPFCWDKGEIRKVSDVEPSWKKIIKEESKPKEYFLKFER